MEGPRDAGTAAPAGRRVVVCHAEGDRARAVEVLATLPEALDVRIGGVRTGEGAPGGAAPIADDVVVLILTEAGHRDAGLLVQGRAAGEGGIPVVAVRVDAVDPASGSLADLRVDRWVDVFLGGVAAHGQDLVDAVHSTLDVEPADVADDVFDVFVCHSSSEAAEARALVDALEPELRCWIAPRDIPPGFSYAGGIMHGLDRSRMQVVLFSHRANASPHVLREVNEMVSAGRPVLPVRLVDALPSDDLRYYLGVAQWYDAFHGELDGHLPAIRSAVGVRLATVARTTADPAGVAVSGALPGAPAPGVTGSGAGAALPADGGSTGTATPDTADTSGASDGPAAGPALLGDDASVVTARDGEEVEELLDRAARVLEDVTALGAARDVVRAATTLARLRVEASRMGAAIEAGDVAVAAAADLPEDDPDRVRAEVALAVALATHTLPERTPSPRAAGDLVERADAALRSDDPATLLAARARVGALLVAGDVDGAVRRARSLVNDVQRIHRDEPALRLAGRTRVAWDAFVTAAAQTQGAEIARELLGDVGAGSTGVPSDHPALVEARALADVWEAWPDPSSGQRAIERVETLVGRLHPAYARLVTALVMGARAAGEHAAAADLADALAECRARTTGRDDPSTLWALEQLSFAACDAGDHQRSLDAAEVLLARRRLAAGRGSVLTLNAARWVAWEQYDLGRAADAVATLRDALDDADEAGPTDATRLNAQERLAWYLLQDGRHAEAARTAEQAFTQAATVREAGDTLLVGLARTWRDAARATDAPSIDADRALGEQVLATFDPEAPDPDRARLLADLAPLIGARFAADDDAGAEELAQMLWPVVAPLADEGDLDALDVGLGLAFLVTVRGAVLDREWCKQMWGRLKGLDPDVVLARWALAAGGAPLAVRGCALQGVFTAYLLPRELEVADRYLAGAPLGLDGACLPARAIVAGHLRSRGPGAARRIAAEVLPRWGEVDMSTVAGSDATRALVGIGGATATALVPGWMRARGLEVDEATGLITPPSSSELEGDEELAEDLLVALCAQRDGGTDIALAMTTLQTWVARLMTPAAPFVSTAIASGAFRPGWMNPPELGDIGVVEDDEDLCLQVLGALAVAHLRRAWMTRPTSYGVDTAASDRAYGAAMLTQAIYQYELVWGGVPDLASVGWIVTLREVPGLLPEGLEELLSDVHSAHERAAVEAGRKGGTPGAPGSPYDGPIAPPSGVPQQDLTPAQNLVLGAASWLERRRLGDQAGASGGAGAPSPPGQLEAPPPGGWTLHPRAWPRAFQELRATVERAAADGSLFLES